MQITHELSVAEIEVRLLQQLVHRGPGEVLVELLHRRELDVGLDALHRDQRRMQ